MTRAEFFGKLKNPKTKILVFIVYPLMLGFVGGSIACAATGYEGTWAYFLYGGAAVLLVYSVYTSVSVLYPRIKNALVACAQKHKFSREFVRDYGFRTLIFACVSFTVNAGYAVFEGAMGIMYRSVWRGCLAVYYILLTLIRGVIIERERSCRKRGEDDGAALVRRIKTYGACGGNLIALDAAMCGAVTLMILSDNTVTYPGIGIFVSAAYTFYKIIAAVVHLSKAKKTSDPVVQSLRNINLADALISVAALETAMLASFGGSDRMLPLRAVTGFAVCAITIAMGIAMTVRACSELRRIAAGRGTVRFGVNITGTETLVYVRENKCEQSFSAEENTESEAACCGSVAEGDKVYEQ